MVIYDQLCRRVCQITKLILGDFNSVVSSTGAYGTTVVTRWKVITFLHALNIHATKNKKKKPLATEFNVKKSDWVAFIWSVMFILVGETTEDKVNNIQNSILDTAVISNPKTLTASVKLSGHQIAARRCVNEIRPTGSSKIPPVMRTIATIN